ncbi:hypothetical protein PtrSN002B_006495 [Pyrenophora tritici-repentis]|uniref:Herpes-BLLF1 multi-domain protein n=2 Tax=Pyrenophora tritici-repentis TaxID=45151 RepID=A0A2W1F5R2_9PLEO|nr:uncharacterized protein PTRG_03260 [Pyrenophora tritici-repentis Pt-1C-BFP]KAA8622640.1 hypothetical protein PtrV1_03946 [Pyrenophora tritici-repentis]EDU45783.1 hypothetical protein PTRG_03260 [Pyrenophora tritici-repentis Pt-1C-BFP]KAF7451629.1 hypothetical protein A1F99_034060 [Pyrenophora tritici-repentis]KAF7575261.1 Herpes-BLLF1 multi-domain protein [Pyrenophora tritici-repentis]KAG9385987.1 hypothetical protein A1F94_002737 [Pyrenophora tritici-repentis]
MKFTTTAIAATAATMVSALPQATQFEKISPGDTFHVMSLRTGTPIQFGNMQAANSRLYINAPKQNETNCGDEHNYATFQLGQNGTLNLFTEAPYQSVYVDRSGMAQGAIGFTTGAQPGPKYAQYDGWSITKDSILTYTTNDIFKDQLNFQACPNAVGGGYAVWLGGNFDPAGQKDCIPFSGLAVKKPEDLRCHYSF